MNTYEIIVLISLAWVVIAMELYANRLRRALTQVVRIVNDTVKEEANSVESLVKRTMRELGIAIEANTKAIKSAKQEQCKQGVGLSQTNYVVGKFKANADNIEMQGDGVKATIKVDGQELKHVSEATLTLSTNAPPSLTVKRYAFNNEGKHIVVDENGCQMNGNGNADAK